MMGGQFTVIVVMDQHLVMVITCTSPITRDQTPTPTQILVTPTTSHLVTLPVKPTHAPYWVGATDSPHQKWRYFT